MSTVQNTQVVVLRWNHCLWLVYSKTSSKSSNLPTTDWKKKRSENGYSVYEAGKQNVWHRSNPVSHC